MDRKPIQHIIIIAKSAHGLKSTQWIGRQSPQLVVSADDDNTLQCRTRAYYKGGSRAIWNETLTLPLKDDVESLVVEVMGGNAIIGKETIPLSRINTTPLDITLSLKNSKGKNAGTVNITFQLHIGSEDQLNAVLQVMKSQQAGKISSNLGGFSQPGQSPTIFRCGSSTSGGFQQPSTTAANRPIGGFNVVGNQVAGGAQSSTNRANFFTPNTIDSNSNGFQGDHIQHNVTERGPYIPQAGTGANGQRSFALHEPQPVYAAGHVLPFEPNNENSSLKASAPPLHS